MARVFVSDCLKNITNKNDLVVLAAKHARTIPLPKKLARGNMKNRAVEALRDIQSFKVNEDSIIDAWYEGIRPKSKAVVENID